MQQQQEPPMLIYPSGQFSISITWMDYELLSPGRWLNGTIMEFYGLWLRDRLGKTLRDRVSILSPFVYTQICQQRWDILHRSTGRIDLFNMPALLLPICTRKHWLLAIVSHPGMSQGKSSSIFIADSTKHLVPGYKVEVDFNEIFFHANMF
uniref:Ubiquitin-like protease family profile domain-containing protein n=1 Tax=Glossina austeni TaxID=7395 RepID=A0A1A9V6J2_GLOAU